MGLPIPNLDDTTFEKLVKDARLLIGRYAPEWTDHNVHDPGITFIELFAWLAEMQIYQLNRVTAAQYEKFLRLVGITPADVQPSIVRVTVTEVPVETIIKTGTAISTEIESEPYIFEVDRQVTLLPLVLETIETVLETRVIDRTAANDKDGMYFYPFGEKAPQGVELRLKFDKDLTGKEVHLTLDLGQEPGATSVQLAWEYQEGTQWKSFNIKEDATANLGKSGKVVFVGPPSARIRLRLEKGQYEIVPTIKRIMLNTLSARQIEAVQQDLGQGTGYPHQMVKLDKTPIIGAKTSGSDPTAKNPFVLEVEGPNGERQEWQRVEDFDSSGPEDPHYILDAPKGEIIFGNGLNGLIPQASQAMKFTYKTTRGAGGNIPKNQIFNVAGMKGTNPEPAAGGKEAETIKDAKARARKDFYTVTRAITSADYEKLALETPGVKVARAKAIPNYHPGYPCIKNFPGTVTVVAVPGVGEGEQGNPVEPGEVFLETVRRYLTGRRLVAADLYVIAPQYVKVSVACRVKLQEKSSPAKVKERVLQALAEFLHPLKGGPGKNGWPFGRAVYPAEIYQLLDNIEGVDYAAGITLATAEKQYEPGQPVPVPANALVYSGEHQVDIIGVEGEEAIKSFCG